MTGQDLYDAYILVKQWTNAPRWIGLSPHTRTAWDEAAQVVTKLGQGLAR